MTNVENPQDQGQTPETEEPTRYRQKSTFERQFLKFRRGLELTASDDSLKTKAAQFGYGDAKVAEGLALADEVDRLYKAQKKAKADQFEATQVFRERRAAAETALKLLIQTARLAFKDDRGTYRALGLDQRRVKAYGDWLAQSDLFYTHLKSQPGAIEQMVAYNVTAEQIQAAEQLLTDTKEADKNQEKLKADSQDATELKNKAYRTFKNWMKGFIKVMTVALQDSPQMKEKLGIVTPSTV
jgi:hypothetical protein